MTKNSKKKSVHFRSGAQKKVFERSITLLYIGGQVGFEGKPKTEVEGRFWYKLKAQFKN